MAVVTYRGAGLRLFDTGVDPDVDGQVVRVGDDIKFKSGGVVYNLTQQAPVIKRGTGTVTINNQSPAFFTPITGLSLVVAPGELWQYFINLRWTAGGPADYRFRVKENPVGGLSWNAGMSLDVLGDVVWEVNNDLGFHVAHRDMLGFQLSGWFSNNSVACTLEVGFTQDVQTVGDTTIDAGNSVVIYDRQT